MSNYLIGFSGPPRSGKDTIAKVLEHTLISRHGVRVQSLALSTPMRTVVYNMLGIDYDDEHYEKHKDIPQAAFGGKSIRQAMIAFTEDHVKPQYGAGFWATSLLARRWDPRPEVLIITDVGFPAEVEILTEAYGIENVVYPQITRPGTSFDGDSRSFVGAKGRTTTVINDEDVEVAAGRIYGRLMNQFGWDFS